MGSAQLAEEGPPLAVRAFFGLAVPAAQRSALGEYMTACEPAAPGFRWARPDSLHLTLRFLGHVDTSVALGIATKLASSPLRSFELQPGESGVFKSGRLVRVVWMGLRAGTEEALALARQIEAECKTAGVPGEERRLRPHLTLARSRARGGSSLPPLPAPPALAAWRADELILYRSRPARGGSVYDALRVLRLS